MHCYGEQATFPIICKIDLGPCLKRPLNTGTEPVIGQKSIVLLTAMDVPPPFFVFLTLLGVRGYRLMMPSEMRFVDGNPHPIDTDVMLLPEAVFENYDDNVPKALKLTFDTLWNAGGHPLSVSYDDKGEWILGKMSQ